MPGIRELLHSAAWEVREVDVIECNQKLGEKVTADRYDLGAEYQAKRAKWLATCTKFHAWRLTFLRKIIFLDLVEVELHITQEHKTITPSSYIKNKMDKRSKPVEKMKRIEDIPRWDQVLDNV